MAVRMVCFGLGQQLFGIPIERVKEVISYRPVTRVPLVPTWIAGIINLRGDVVSILDLAAFLGLPPTRITETTKIVVARAAQRTAGVLVDHIDEVRTIQTEGIQPPPPLGSADNRDMLAGVVTLGEGDEGGESEMGGTPMVIMDMDQVLGSERLRQFTPVAAEGGGA